MFSVHTYASISIQSNGDIAGMSDRHVYAKVMSHEERWA